MIRSLTPDDMPQVDALAAEGLEEGFHFGTRWRDAVHAASTTADHTRLFFLGVFDDATLVALGGVTPDPYDEEPGLGRVRHVYVAAHARRRGIGRRLLESLEGHSRVAYCALRLRTDTARAASFYEALGYVRTDEPSATHRRNLASPSDLNGAAMRGP